jgi:phospholipid/cholesterol/gamma-HCH transport system substrate-binding protein
MSIKANFFKIGLFVIFTCTLFMVGVVFWGAEAFNQEKYYAETYTDESVQGLTVGSQVFTRGVQIGEVAEIAFVSAIYDIE